MPLPMLNKAPLEAFAGQLQAEAGKQNSNHDAVAAAFSKAELLYKNHLKTWVKQFRILDLDSTAMADLGQTVYDYLWAMRWVGWGNYEFSDALQLEVDDEFPLAIMAYLSARFIDDAIDGHPNYKDKCATVYGHLAEKYAPHQAAGACTIIGNMLLNHALLALKKAGHHASAAKVAKLYSFIIPGALAESFVKNDYSIDVYNKIIQRKSVAYDAVLHQVYFARVVPPYNHTLVQMMARFSELAQWLNDFEDEEDDLLREQLNILQARMMNPYAVTMKIYQGVECLWKQCEKMPPNLKQVWAKRLSDVMNKLVLKVES